MDQEIDQKLTVVGQRTYEHYKCQGVNPDDKHYPVKKAGQEPKSINIRRSETR